MDSLRSCYRTLMRFPGVGIVPIQWYWTDKPVLDKVHVYGSHNHTREEGWDDYDTGEPGEVWGAPRYYVKGEPPLVAEDGEPHGSDAAWLGQTDSSSPMFSCGEWGHAYDESFSNDYDSPT